jgi:thioredoxin 1
MDVEELKKFGLKLPNNYKDGILICDIYTDWCGPCRILSPTLEKLEKKGLFKLVKVNLEENRSLGEKFNIHAIPTLLFFKDGKLLEGIIEAQGQQVVINGMMIGNYGETIITEAISKIR